MNNPCFTTAVRGCRLLSSAWFRGATLFDHNSLFSSFFFVICWKLLFRQSSALELTWNIWNNQGLLKIRLKLEIQIFCTIKWIYLCSVNYACFFQVYLLVLKQIAGSGLLSGMGSGCTQDYGWHSWCSLQAPRGCRKFFMRPGCFFSGFHTASVHFIWHGAQGLTIHFV